MSDQVPITIAASYIRVSTEDQVEYSPDSQRKKIQEYAKQHGLLIPDEYVFVDSGISGRTAAKRPAFLRMISMAKEKPRPFDVILVWKFSRFARNQEESIVYKSMLKKTAGIDVVSVSEPLPDDVFGSLIERIIEWMDQFYSIRLSGEVKRGMAEKVTRGEPVSIPPLGYDMQDKKLVPNSMAESVRDIFSSYARGEGMRAIATRLGASGIRTPRGNPPDNRFIDYILHNPVYIGKIRWSKDGKAASLRQYDHENIIITDGHHPPLIDMDTWDAVQARMASVKKEYPSYARKEQTVDWALKGLCRCSVCGGTLCASRKDYMQCHNYSRGSCHVSHCIRMDKAEALVADGLRSAILTGSFRLDPPAPSAPSSAPDYSLMIKLEERKLSRIREAYLSGADSLEEYKQNKAAIQKTLSTLRAQQCTSHAQSVPDLPAFREKVSAVLQVLTSDATPQTKNASLRTILSKIVYNKPTQSLDLYFHC